MKLTAAERKRAATAFHEAGHAVAVVLAGGTISEVVVTYDDAETPGHCTYDESLSETVDQRITFAGPWAEARWRHGPLPTVQQIRACLGVNESDRDELLASGEPLPREIEPTLNRCWPAIVTVASELFAAGRLGHDDVTAALGLDDPVTEATARAGILAGYAPGEVTIYPPGSMPL